MLLVQRLVRLQIYSFEIYLYLLTVIIEGSTYPLEGGVYCVLTIIGIMLHILKFMCLNIYGMIPYCAVLYYASWSWIMCLNVQEG
jgi:hypothetical protein